MNRGSSAREGVWGDEEHDSDSEEELGSADGWKVGVRARGANDRLRSESSSHFQRNSEANMLQWRQVLKSPWRR